MFLEITPANITELLGYAKGLIVDLTPLLLLIIGVGLGVIVFMAVINSIKR